MDISYLLLEYPRCCRDYEFNFPGIGWQVTRKQQLRCRDDLCVKYLVYTFSFFFHPFFSRAYQIFSSTFCLICASLMSYHDEKVIFRTEKIFIYFHAKFHISSSEQKYHIFPSFFSIFSPFLNGRLISTLDYFVHIWISSILFIK